MASSIPHSIFIQKQSEHGLNRTVQLKRLSDTRWSCRHASIKSVKSTISVIYDILELLQEIIEGNDSNSCSGTRPSPSCQKLSVSDLSYFFEKIFSITAKLSDLLQAEQLNYAAAASCITATKQAICDIRSETE